MLISVKDLDINYLSNMQKELSIALFFICILVFITCEHAA